MELELSVNEQVITVPVVGMLYRKGKLMYRIMTSMGTQVIAASSGCIVKKQSTIQAEVQHG